MKVAKNQLTARQQEFCQHYVGSAGHNSALASRMAGYSAASSHVTGCQLLQKPKIAAVVRGLEATAAVDMAITRQRVINELVGAFDMAKLMQNPASMIASMRQIALMCGYYKQDVVEVAPPQAGINVLEQMNAMSDTELLAVIATGQPVASQ